MGTIKRKTAMYCRSVVADEAAMRSQEELLIRFAEANGFCDCQVFRDYGASGVTYDRPEFQRMMLGIKRGEVDCVIVKDFARLSRNPIQLAEWLDEMQSSNVRVISVNDGYDSLKSRAEAVSRLAEAAKQMFKD